MDDDIKKSKRIPEEEKEWASQQKQYSDAGLEISAKAAEDALEYIEEVTKNFDKLEHRKSAMSKHAMEIGLAIHFKSNIIEGLLPELQVDLEGDLGKAPATLITSLFLARVLRNIVEEVNKYEGK